MLLLIWTFKLVYKAILLGRFCYNLDISNLYGNIYTYNEDEEIVHYKININIEIHCIVAYNSYMVFKVST